MLPLLPSDEDDEDNLVDFARKREQQQQQQQPQQQLGQGVGGGCGYQKRAKEAAGGEKPLPKGHVSACGVYGRGGGWVGAMHE